MKKLMYIATALFVLASCSNKDNALNNAPEGTPFKKGQQVTLTVGTGNNANQAAPRKVAGTDNGTQINFTWEAGDQILVKVGDESAVFTLSSTPSSAEGEFAGVMPADGSTFDIQYPTEAPDLTAQVYTEENPIPANKMLFTATNCTLDNPAALTAQYAMLQLNLYGTDITVGKIVFWNKTASPAVSYTLTCTDGKAIGTASTAATSFYMVVPAGEYKFKVEIWDAATTPAKICSFTTSAAKTFTAGKCLNMPAKEVVIFVPTYVDLGLPSGLKWATCNVGAEKPEEYGDYFAWGETSPQLDNSYSEGSYSYNDNPTVLPADHDAARQNWGSNWRMPTKEEQDELFKECNCDWTNNYNQTKVAGYIIKSKNNSIFLPAAGNRHNNVVNFGGARGYYWSSSLYVDDQLFANYIYFIDYEGGVIKCERYYGFSVRPVYCGE